MRVIDPLLFLIGHRGAIERIAATRHAWITGAILVLSAGIARNYDHLDLLLEPEWFIGPFAASLVSIVFIFLCIEGPLKLFAVGPLGKQFGTFLTFAWMTAPCAWLYGIPVESHTDLITATKWNIAFLAIVSLWRVALMTRVVAVLTGVTNLRAFVLVLTPAAFEAVAGLYVKAMSLVQIMGGVRLPPGSKLLREASEQALGISFVLVVVGIIACNVIKGRAEKPLYRPAESPPGAGLAFAIPALLIWILLSLPLHPKLSNKARLERLLRSRDYPAAIAFAASKSRYDFPRIHHFPPEPKGWFPFDLLDAMPPETPAWLREEWTTGAIESLKMRLTFSEERWKEFSKRHPRVVAELSRYASELKSSTTKDSYDEWWLRQFERLNKRPEPPPERFDPTQLPPPGK
jgi:hypothetical protein